MADTGNIPPTGPISVCNLQNVIRKQNNCSTTLPGACCKLNDIGGDMYQGRNTQFFFPNRQEFDNVNRCTLKVSNFRQASVLTTSLFSCGESSSTYKNRNNGCVWGFIDESTVTCGGGGAAANVKRVFIDLVGSGKTPITKDVTSTSCQWNICNLNAPNTFTLRMCDPYLATGGQVGGFAAITRSGISIAYNSQTINTISNCLQSHLLI
tara:strand:+ start:253 stop:879 length:627 start_codon:yes stop_codon:yes gene_type:complete